ncbi:pectin lyase, partial [Verticillium dahliae]
MHLNFLLGAMVMATAATRPDRRRQGLRLRYRPSLAVDPPRPSHPRLPASWRSFWLDDVPRTIVINKTWDFTGAKATGSGCDRKSCSDKNGGQLYLGTLSCGGSDNVAVSSIKYDKAGLEPLIVGSNKSIIGSGAGVLNGKGLQIKKNAKNVIIQGFEIRNLNPGIVWGGDAIDLKGGNDGVWIDHMKISLVGRMFIVTHYDGSRVTVSNSEFDGQTTTSASCNGDHYWTMMFYGKGDRVTLDRNYYHDVSGRAPKLGQDGTTGTFQATNNYFKNMQGHAFDIYSGATALIEGNVFRDRQEPLHLQQQQGHRLQRPRQRRRVCLLLGPWPRVRGQQGLWQRCPSLTEDHQRAQHSCQEQELPRQACRRQPGFEHHLLVCRPHEAQGPLHPWPLGPLL